jgi:hypothetical protein
MSIDMIGLSLDFDTRFEDNKENMPVMCIMICLPNADQCLPNDVQKCVNKIFQQIESYQEILNTNNNIYPENYLNVENYNNITNFIETVSIEINSYLSNKNFFIPLLIFNYNLNMNIISDLIKWLNNFTLSTKITNNKWIFERSKLNIDIVCLFRKDFIENVIDINAESNVDYTLNKSNLDSLNNIIVELYEEEYQVFSITNLNNVLTLELKNLQKNIPSRIKIKSNIINQQIYNNKHSRDISIISINKNVVYRVMGLRHIFCLYV